MKRTFKKSMSILLAFTLLFGSFAFGLSDVNWADFAVKAEAEDATETFTEGYYTYTVDENGNATITDVDSSISGDISIPSTLGGYPVTFIGYQAFKDFDGITSVTIPAGVTEIGTYTFAHCVNLEKISLPGSIVKIGNSAFSECDKLSDVYLYETDFYWHTLNMSKKISNGNSYLLNSNMHFMVEPYREFGGECEFDNLTWRFIEATKTLTIGGEGKMVDYGEYIKMPPWYDNYVGTFVEKIEIGCGVTYVNDWLLEVVETPSNISVDPANTVYSSNENGVLFSKDKTTLICYPRGNTRTNYEIPNTVTNISPSSFIGSNNLIEVTIPNTVKNISTSTFEKCENLTTVTMNEGLESIGSSAFKECSNLASIKIPNTVTNIGASAFESCTNLTEITIPDSVKDIGSDAFLKTGYAYDKSNWENDVLYINNHLISARYKTSHNMDYELLYGDYEIKEGTLTIADAAFAACPITSVIIPESIAKISVEAFSGCKQLADVKIPKSVIEIEAHAFSGCNSFENIIIPENVNEIGNYAFSECKNLSSLKILGSENIGENAFDNCSNLVEISISDSVQKIGKDAFLNTDFYEDLSNWENGVLYISRHLIKADNDSIPKIYEVKSGTKTIADYAFYECNNLKDISVPSGATSIGDYAFYRCYNLENIKIGNGVTYIGNYAFYECDIPQLNIPSSVTYIGNYAFYEGVRDVTELIIPENVEYIGNYAFTYAYCITTLKIGNNVTHIGDYAFFGSNSLEDVNIPDSVITIGDRAFGNSSLKNITIGSGVKFIGKDALDCKIFDSDEYEYIPTLENITVNASNSFYSSDDYGVLFNKDKTELILYPIGNARTSYVIPNSVTSIGDSAFEDCKTLTTVTIGNNVKSIGEEAFYSCSNLEYITIPDSVTSIGEYAFFHCLKLASITVNPANTIYSSDDCGVLFNKDKTELIQYPIRNTRKNYVIPETVNQIKDYAFYYSFNLINVIIPNGVTNIGWAAFEYCSEITDVYFMGSKEEWNKIVIDKDNDPLINATIHFDCKPEDIPTFGSSPTEPTTNPSESEPSTTKPAEIPATKPTTTQPATKPEETTKPTTEPASKPAVEPTKPVATVPSTKPATEPTTAPTTKPVVEEEIIKKPSTSTVKYGETLILHADFENIPANAKIEWSVEGNGVTIVPSEDGKTCAVTSTSTGDVTVTAKYTDADGVEHVSEQEIKSNASFWQKIVSFFKNLFGINRIIEQTFKF